MAVIWNPTVRKSIGIYIPFPKAEYIRTMIGFGVCPYTSDPKLVKISVSEVPSRWEVDIFTLSTRVWKTVYIGAPFKSCDLSWFEAFFVNGLIYFSAFDDIDLYNGVRSNFVISFDFKSKKFDEVCLPEILVHAPLLKVTKVNESLGLLEYNGAGDITVCSVWTRKYGDNIAFSKIYTIKVEGKSLYDRVLGFRNNGEAVVELKNDDRYEESVIEVYEPLSGHTNGVGIHGKTRTFSVRSYMETLLLLDESDSIIF